MGHMFSGSAKPPQNGSDDRPTTGVNFSLLIRLVMLVAHSDAGSDMAPTVAACDHVSVAMVSGEKTMKLFALMMMMINDTPRK